MGYRIKVILRATQLLVIAWTVLITGLIAYTWWQDRVSAEELARHEADITLKKDFAMRKWGASHGGVYVPITERTPPNYYLRHIKNRDVNTTDGQQLTLMNPAYMMSQILRDYTALYGIKGKITSDKLLNPKNKPDAWEATALKHVISKNQPFDEISDIDGILHFRLMAPMVVRKACLKCHHQQGYKIGDVRGGITVGIPMGPYYAISQQHTLRAASTYIIIWLIGLIAIYIGYSKLRQIIEEKLKNYEQHIFSLVDIIEQRDSYTAGHTNRVAEYATKIAKAMNYSEEEVNLLYRACMLHDIGKISTPDSILLKPGHLTRLEFDIIREHVTSSYELLRKVDIYHEIAEIVRHHHERYDGKGYPQQLAGDAIPMLSQVMSVADAFDAMTTDRIYRGRKTVTEALDELQTLSGQQFHPDIVKVALEALKDTVIEHHVSQQPSTKLERARFAYFYKDQVTQAFNREYLQYVLNNNSAEEFGFTRVYAIFLQNFTQYNRIHSWEAGDKLLSEIANKLQELVKDGLVFRLYGDDFILLGRGDEDIEACCDALKQLLELTEIGLKYKSMEIPESGFNTLQELEEQL